MTADEFINRLEQQRLLDEGVLASLRRRVAKKGGSVTPESVAKLLVEKGHLTSFQARMLLGEKAAGKSQQRPATAPAPRGTGGGKPTTPPADDELGLAPDDELTPVADDELTAVRDDELTLMPGDDLRVDDELGLADDELAVTRELDAAPAGDDDGESDAPAHARDADPNRLSRRRRKRPAFRGDPGPPPSAAQQGPAAGDDVVDLDYVAEGAAPPPPVGSPGYHSAAMYGGLQHGDPLADPSTGAPGLASLSSGMGQPMPGSVARPPKKHRTSKWESPLMLIGGGALLLLAMLMAFLIFVLTRGDATEMFQLAEDDYNAGSYSQAIERYDRFLAKFPRDEKAGLARVRSVVATLHLKVDGKNWVEALEVAHQRLPEVEEEESFSEARPELATLLPDIAEGFAHAARSASNTAVAEENAALTDEALELVNNSVYLPTSLRQTQLSRIERIGETLALARRNIERDNALAAGLEKIEAAAADHRTAQAYAIYKDLIRDFPALEASDALSDAVRSVTEQERLLVTVGNENLAPLVDQEPPRTRWQVLTATRSGTGLSGSEDRMTLVLARGAVYGIEAKSGRVRWRRFVGHETTIWPMLMSRQAGGDALLVDSRRHELVRVRADDGQLVWRLPIGRPFFEPVTVDSSIYVATEDGRVLEIDAASGNCSRYAQFPQPLAAAPGYDAKRSALYLVGSHSTLYMLSLENLRCQQAYYLGHKEGTVAVPATVVQGFAFIAENAGVGYSFLHAVAPSGEDGSLESRGVENGRLKGRVVVPLVPYKGQTIAVTDVGEIRVFRVDAAQEDQPVRSAGRFVGAWSQPVVGYPLADEGRLWVADRRFTLLKIQSTLGELSRVWVKDDGPAFVGPLQLFGESVIAARRRRDSPGVTVSAVRGDDYSPQWQLDLGEAVAGLLNDNASPAALQVVTARGELITLDASTRAAGYVDDPGAAAGLIKPGVVFSDGVELAPGKRVYFDPRRVEQLLLYDASNSARPLSTVNLEIEAGAASVSPVAFHGGLLVPTSTGQVQWVDPLGAQPRLLPFQPPLEAGARVAWRRPAVIPGALDEFVIADSRRKVYRVGVRNEPQPHLASMAELELDASIDSPLAACGGVVYGVVRRDSRDVVVSLALPALKPGQEFELQGRVVWGPESVGGTVLLSTDVEGLICFEDGGKRRWAQTYGHGPIVGRPLPVGGDFILASQQGIVWRVDGLSGEELARWEVGEPLATGPIVLGDDLVVGGADGMVFAVASTKADSAAASPAP